jgi:hypothetical protein
VGGPTRADDVGIAVVIRVRTTGTAAASEREQQAHKSHDRQQLREKSLHTSSAQIVMRTIINQDTRMVKASEYQLTTRGDYTTCKQKKVNLQIKSR